MARGSFLVHFRLRWSKIIILFAFGFLLGLSNLFNLHNLTPLGESHVHHKAPSGLRVLQSISEHDPNFKNKPDVLLTFPTPLDKVPSSTQQWRGQQWQGPTTDKNVPEMTTGDEAEIAEEDDQWKKPLPATRPPPPVTHPDRLNEIVAEIKQHRHKKHKLHHESKLVKRNTSKTTTKQSKLLRGSSHKKALPVKQSVSVTTNARTRTRPTHTKLRQVTAIPTATRNKTFNSNATNITNTLCLTPAGKSPVEILQVDSRPLVRSYKDADYNSMTSVINYLYAKRHGYPYVYARLDLHDRSPGSNNFKDDRTCNHPTIGDRASPWCKLLAIYFRLHGQWAERIMYIDTDAIIEDTDKRLSETINETPVLFNSASVATSSMIVGTDWPWHFGGLLAPATSGIMLFTVSQMSEWILKAWWGNDDYADQNFRHPYEQTTLTRSLMKWNNSQLLRKHISVLDWKAFHDQDGQFFRHIGKADGKDRIPFFQNKLKQLGVTPHTFEQLIIEIEANCLVVPDVATLEKEMLVHDMNRLPKPSMHVTFDTTC
eukprot:m.27576 g.27576  ORF g.27576 m.27576 type:complete len:542 (+) comp15770_c0_seq2:422-2047(+)